MKSPVEEKQKREPGKANSTEEVLELLEAGEISASEAFVLFQKLDRTEAQNGRAEVDSSDWKRLEEAMQELDSLIGLESVKKLVKELGAFVQIQKKRAEQQLATEPLVLHMVFKGNPGTGKTTVARILGKIFREMGVLPKGHLVEVERADLVGEYIGHTAQKTREQLERAMGGILFIDEAYSLARGGEKDFGKEAIDTLVKSMEDNKENLLLILAGYMKEMDWFLRSNPGLRSRFPIHIEFPDYTAEELMKIADLMLKRRQYRLTPGARQKLAGILRRQASMVGDKKGNARDVRNIIEQAIRSQAVRLVDKPKLTREELILITEDDIEEVS